MTDRQIRFDDGAAYERMMGAWSRLAGDVFLDWLAPARGLRWVDVGCGNGAFTELLIERCAGTTGQMIAAMPPADAERLKAAVRARLPVDTLGRIICDARANAVQGRVAGP